MALTGKTAVITGAFGGIGFATANHYLNEGIKNLALLDVIADAEKLAQLQSRFSEANIIPLVTDITKKDAIEGTFQTILDKFKQIDIVVNGAGILREDDLELVIATNLIDLINSSMVALDAMSKANGGNGGIIVNIASAAGIAVAPGTPIYNATKHGVVGFTRTMAFDCYFSKHGVKFITVCPGMTDTQLGHKFFSEANEAMNKTLTPYRQQTTDACGKCITDITAAAKNGSIWVIIEGKCEEITIPRPWTI